MTIKKTMPHTQILVLVSIGIVICLCGLAGLKTNADYRVYFNPNDPLLQADNALGKQYARLDSLLLILSVEKGSLLEPALLNLYPVLEQQLASIEHVGRVTGFFQFLEDEGNLEVEVVESAVNESAEDLLLRLRAHPRGVNMIAADGRFGLLNVGVSLPGINTAKEVKQFMSTVETVVNKQLVLNELPVTVHYSGTLALNEAYIDVVRHDMKRFVPCLLLIFMFCLFIYFRHWGVCFLLMGTALLSAIAAFGVIGWLHWELAAINAFTPIIIMSLNIATSMHVVVNYFRFVAAGTNRVDAMAQSIQYNLTALTLSKLTTAFGFLLLSFSPSPPVQVVGYTVAIGMIISYVLCLSILRIVLPQLQLSREQAKSIVVRFSLGNLGTWTFKYRTKIIMFSVIVIVIGLVAIQRLQINDNVYEYFPEEHRFRQGTQLIDDHFDGSIRLFYSLNSGAPFGVLEPAYTKMAVAFTTWLRDQEIVARVDDIYSLAVKKGVQLNTIHPVLETNSPSMLGLEQEVSETYRAVKVSVFLKVVTAREVLAFDKQVKDWLDVNITPYRYEGGVGPDLLFARLGERNARSMFFSLSLALAMIALIIGALVRSWSAVGIGLVCNLLPVITVFAIWSLVGGYISLGSAMVMGMIIGIIVDDTLHMLLKFPRSSDASTSNQVLSLYEKVCPAIVITSITLAAGLLVGVFSGFRPIYELSLLTIFIILAAMLVDLFLLPALMQVVNFRRT